MSPPPDAEHILALAQSGDWAAAWSALHDATPALKSDDRLSWAASTLADATLAAVDAGPMTDALADALERLVLLHSGGLYRVSGERFQAAVTQLVAYHRADGQLDIARRYARFCPNRPVCAAVLDDARSSDATTKGDGANEAQPDRTVPVHRREIDHEHSDRFRLSVTEPISGSDRTSGLFRSPLEQTFFHAVREVFPTYTPYPNVALKSVVDVDALKPQLTGAERSFLYTGLVDCVLFDPQESFWPVAFFELDSAHHDAPDRKERDAQKDRILAIAGRRLYRIRPHDRNVNRADLVRLLRQLPSPIESSG